MQSEIFQDICDDYGLASKYLTLHVMSPYNTLVSPFKLNYLTFCIIYISDIWALAVRLTMREYWGTSDLRTADKSCFEG